MAGTQVHTLANNFKLNKIKTMKKILEIVALVKANLPKIRVYVGQAMYIIDMLDGVRDWDKPKDHNTTVS